MNHTRNKIIKALVFLNFTFITSALQYDCSRTEYERCVKMADPLIKEVHLIFPDNMDDIDMVCRTWNNFVDCLKKYTERCFTDQQRQQFNKAVENPIESIHQMCTQPDYQKEYLQYAPCMKSTVVDGAHCGPHYSLLVDQVDQGDVISKATLCCSHDRFKQCVLRETREMCDRGVPDGPAARFSAQIIDKALSFLQDQCYNYIPNSGDCTAITTDSLPFSDTLMISTSPSEVYPWSTVHEMPAPKEEILPSKVVPPMASSSSWLPSSNIPDTANTQYDSSYSVSTHNLGSRTRPASYGRASSWSDTSIGENTKPGINTVQTFSDTPQSTPPLRPAGATVSTWTVVNPSPEVRKTVHQYESERMPVDSTASSSTTWYPAAGSQMSNEVDEPNQLGLTKPKNKENKATAQHISVLVLVLSVAILSAFY